MFDICTFEDNCLKVKLAEANYSWRKPNSVVGLNFSQGTIVKHGAQKKPFSGTAQLNSNPKLPNERQSMPKKKNFPF
jgi:hypothetical protein